MYIALKSAAAKTREREDKMRAFAGRLGQDFHPDGKAFFGDTLKNIPLFRKSDRMQNVILGKTELAEVAILDFTYVVGSGNSSTTYRQNVILFTSSRLNLPKFGMRPENFLDKIAGALGYPDIDFSSQEAFSKRYLLKGEDEDAVRAVFTDSMLTYLESKEKLSIEGVGTRLAIYRLGERLEPDQLPELMEEASEILNRFLP